MMERWFSGSTVAAPAIFAMDHHRPEVDDTCAGGSIVLIVVNLRLWCGV